MRGRGGRGGRGGGRDEGNSGGVMNKSILCNILK